MSRPLPAEVVPAPRSGADGSVRVNLTMPVTRLGFGPLSFDPVEQMIGAPLTDILESLLVSAPYRRPSEAGAAIEVYPLALPDGEGASVPLGQWGEIGFCNERGLLVLTVPLFAGKWIEQRFAGALVGPPRQRLSHDGTARVVDYRVRLRAGMRAAFPLGVMGEVGVEAG